MKKTNRQSVAPPAGEAGSAAPDVPAALRSVTRWMKGLVVLVIGSWGLLAMQMLPRHSGDTGASNAGTHSAGGRPATPWTPGATGHAPWGQLTYLPITISPPLELVPQLAPGTFAKVEWHFPNMISARLPAVLSEIGLSQPVREKLVSLAEINPGIQGLTIRPTREIVLALSPEERSALYAVLDAVPENLYQRGAFRFCGTSLDQWIGDSPLSPEARKLIEPLVYRHGRFLFFADLAWIEQSLPSPEERARLVRALSYESTFLVRLELSDRSDLEELVDYWGRGGRTQDVRPILESLHEAGGNQSIDITYLLPPFARRRIYTYQVFTEHASSPGRDCHWTAMNFFAEQPDDRFGDTQEVVRELKQNYYRVYGDLRLGDFVGFFYGHQVIHSAVFVADDILFTKNGSSSAHPWMLIKLEDMTDFYPRRGALEICYFRRKDL